MSKSRLQDLRRPRDLLLPRLLSMPYTHTEDQLVEQPAIGLFAELRCQRKT